MKLENSIHCQSLANKLTCTSFLLAMLEETGNINTISMNYELISIKKKVVRAVRISFMIVRKAHLYSLLCYYWF